jgi:hypothetical protein
VLEFVRRPGLTVEKLRQFQERFREAILYDFLN